VPGHQFVSVTASPTGIAPRESLAFQPPIGAGIVMVVEL